MYSVGLCVIFSFHPFRYLAGLRTKNILCVILQHLTFLLMLIPFFMCLGKKRGESYVSGIFFLDFNGMNDHQTG